MAVIAREWVMMKGHDGNLVLRFSGRDVVPYRMRVFWNDQLSGEQHYLGS